MTLRIYRHGFGRSSIWVIKSDGTEDHGPVVEIDFESFGEEILEAVCFRLSLQGHTFEYKTIERSKKMD